MSQVKKQPAKKTICRYSQCGQPFSIKWGGPAVVGNRRLYCCAGHRMKAERERASIRRKNNRPAENARSRRKSYAVKGRQCKWPHCQVDDEVHITSWNAPNSICPSCYRQANRVGSCSRCGGPLYTAHRRRNSIYCPTCEPLTPTNGEVSVTLVCSVTGRERSIVRGINWKLPDGTPLQDLADFGFAVIDVEPEVWARYRK